MKKVSIAGIVLGMLLGAVVALLSGSWVFWLGGGLAIGLMVGSAYGRRERAKSLTGAREVAG